MSRQRRCGRSRSLNRVTVKGQVDEGLPASGKRGPCETPENLKAEALPGQTVQAALHSEGRGTNAMGIPATEDKLLQVGKEVPAGSNL